MSDVQDDDGFEGKNCGRGDTEREGMGVDVAVDDTDERPDGIEGGKRKSGPDEPVEEVDAMKEARDRVPVCEVLAVSPESVLEELS